MKYSKMKMILSAVLVTLLTASILPTENLQLLPTNLRVTVLDDLGNIQEGAVVVIYDNEQDYRFETNPIAGPEETDKKGRVTFKKIPAQSYYIMAMKGEKKNDGKGLGQVNWRQVK